ncbi:hypothetical protein [Streptomyces pilosus]|uniref:hypothetical protein n=1 Tax=Streptomyces pilosus TaxID=28893 RepID=UPI00362878AC
MSQTRRPSSQNRPRVSRPGPGGLRFGMFAVCVTRDSDPGLNKGKAKNLYHLLITYSDVSSRNTAQGYPYRSALADALDCTKDTVDNATKYLEQEIGLIRVVRRKVEGQPDQNDANEYQVFDQWLIQGCEPTPDTPPQLVARYGPTIPGFDVAAWIAAHAPSFDLAGWRAAYEEKLRAQEAKRAEQRRKEAQRRKPKRKGGSGTDSATRGGTESATGGGMSAALSRAGSPEPSPPDDEAPSGRSPGGVRSTSTSGSSEAEDGSGFAAAGNEGSSSDEEDATAGVPGQRQAGEPELSREQMAAVRAVEALLPPVLVAKLPYQQFPRRNRPAVLQALESRTLEQLRERVERRWVAYGYEPALYDGSITQPIGAALELIVPPRYCPDLSCEDGTMIDTGEECRACLERRANRRAARAAGLEVKAGSSKTASGGRMPECVICQAPFPGKVPEDGECLTCRKEAEAAMAVLSARLDAPDTEWQPWDAPAADDPAEDVDEDDGVDEETTRLRAALARQYGTPAQVEAYCTEAPF